MRTVTSKTNFFIVLGFVLIGMLASVFLVSLGYKIQFYSSDIKVQEIQNASVEFNKMIANVVEDNTKIEVSSANIEIDEKKYMSVENFLALTGDSIDENNCFVHNEFIVPITEELVIEKNGVKYVNFDLLCSKLGYGYNETQDGVTLFRQFATKRLIVDEVKDVKFTYGAIDKVCADDYVFLQYETELEAMTAYQSLSVTNVVDIDSRIEAPQSLCANEEDVAYNKASNDSYGENFYSWGGDVMGFNEYAAYLNQVCQNDLNEVIAVVIDSGINYNHPFFEGRLHPYSVSFAAGTLRTEIMDTVCHGTHVAGTIAELTPSNVKILSIKVMDAAVGGFMGSVQLAYSYVLTLIDKGLPIKVINASFGARANILLDTVRAVVFGHERKIKQLVDEGVAFCAGAGNDSIDAKKFTPANMEEVITIGAINKDLQLAEFSNFGEDIEVVAPGVDIYSADYRTNNLLKLSGTSMATPHVAAAAAIMFSDSKENYTLEDIKQLLTTTCAVDLGQEGKDNFYGYGYPDLRKLIKPLQFDNKEEMVLTNYTVKLQSVLVNDNSLMNENLPVISISYIGSDYNLGIINYECDFEYTPMWQYDISTYNGLTFSIKDSSVQYNFLGWKISQNSNLANEKYYSIESISTVKNMPDGTLLYVLAVFDYKTFDMNLVLNFKDVSEFNGWMGYGVNCQVRGYINSQEDTYQTFNFSTTPRKMAFQVKDVIPFRLSFWIYVDDGCGIGKVRFENDRNETFYDGGGAIEFTKIICPAPLDDSYTVVFEIFV